MLESRRVELVIVRWGGGGNKNEATRMVCTPPHGGASLVRHGLAKSPVQRVLQLIPASHC